MLVSAGISFGLDIEQIEDMSPALLAGALKVRAEREESTIAQVFGAVAGGRRRRVNPGEDADL